MDFRINTAKHLLRDCPIPNSDDSVELTLHDTITSSPPIAHSPSISEDEEDTEDLV